MRFQHFLSLCVSASLVGCGAGKSDPQEAPVHLSPDAVLLFEGPVFDSGAQSTFRPGILDVSHDGARVAVLQVDGWSSSTVIHEDPGCVDCPGTVGSAGGGTSIRLYLSEDTGKTWRTVELGWNSWQGNGGPYGIHLGGGRAIVMGGNSNVGAKGEMYAEYTLRELDFATGKYIPNAAIDRQATVETGGIAGGHIFATRFQGSGTLVAGRKDDSSLSAPEAIWVYDMTARQVRQVAPNYPSGLQYCGEAVFTADGGAMAMFCVSSTQWCEITCSLLDGATASRCVPAGAVPNEGGLTEVQWTTRGLISKGGDDKAKQATALGLDAAGKLELQTLGDGGSSAFDGAYVYAHQAYGNFVNRLLDKRPIDVTLTGATRYAIPTPCSDSSCGSEEPFLFWLEPLGSGTYLAFSRVNSRLPDPGQGPAYHDHLYVWPVTFGSGESLDPPSHPSALAGIPDLHDASAVEAACLVANSCSVGNWDFAFDCPQYWSQFPDTAPARMAFLSAAKSGCPAMKSVYTNGACVGACAKDMPTSCPTPGPDRCDGDNLIRCTASPASKLYYFQNCKDLGMVCRDSGAGASCQLPDPKAITNCGNTAPYCQGTQAIWCFSQGFVHVDCADWGFASCVANPSVQTLKCQ